MPELKKKNKIKKPKISINIKDIKELKKQKGGELIAGIGNLISSFGDLGKALKAEVDLLMNMQSDLNASSAPAPGAK